MAGVVAALMIIVALGAGCGSSGPRKAAATPSAPTGTGKPTARPSGSLPSEAAAKPGGTYYAVFLALARDAKDRSLAEAQDRARALGYQGGVGDLNCTPGARAALRLSGSGDYTAYSIFFETAERAKLFVDSYSGKVLGTAYVTAGCLD